MTDLGSLRELGELGVIRIFERTLGRSQRTVVGFGDDISAVKLGGRRVLVLKTDMLVGSTDVPPGMSMRQVARKAVVANVSDMAAKGVRPVAGLVALGLPAHMTESDVTGLASGLREAAGEYEFALVGGDTNESKDLTISIALFGLARRSKLILRSGARVGDVVAVTGEFGSTVAGLKALLEEKKRPKQLRRELYQAVYNPQAQLDIGLRLAASGALTSSIDSSDGLAWSLHELSRASKVGMRIERIPVTRAALNYSARFDWDPNKLALYGGEEYCLVVTVKPGRVNSARRAARGRLLTIGTVTPGLNVVYEAGGNSFKIERKGWEHFRHSSYS